MICNFMYNAFVTALFITLLLPINCATALASPSSSLLSNTNWKLRLDVGFQNGSWMPKRNPGWGESGARLGVDVDIQFTSTPSTVRETLVGPKESTFKLEVRSDKQPSTFVSERGQEEVRFESGGWCIQRPNGNVKNAAGGLVKPEGLLRFWIDCPSGAKRNDVEVFPGTRIFFTTGVWESSEDVKKADDEYRKILEELQETVDITREEKNKERENTVDELLSFRKMVGNAKEFDRLKARKNDLEQQLPPSGTAQSQNGVQIAPSGSLVVKGNSIPDWLPGSEYLILGTFSTKASED